MRSAWLALGLVSLAVSAAQAQDMQGFDPAAPAVPDFKATAFYDANLDFAGKQPGDILKTESIPAPKGAVAWR